MSAITAPAFYRHLSFNRHSLSSFSSLRPATCTLPLVRRYVFKPQNSLQTHKPGQHSHHSPALASMTSIPPALDSVPSKKQGASNPELRAVLELATDSELFELERILFGPSYFSPLLKSVTNGVELDRFMIEVDFEEREQFIDVLESRFLYLAADARSTLRGWRPSYRNVLLDVRKELNIPCSRKLPTEDLELEIFIHMIYECSRIGV